MNPDRGDDYLRQRFEDLRNEDRSQARAFRAPVRRPSPRLHPAWVLTVLLIIAVGLLWGVRDGDPRHAAMEIDLAGSEWVAPTDFLLETPGWEFLAGVPVIGAGALAPTSRPAGDDEDSLRRGQS